MRVVDACINASWCFLWSGKLIYPTTGSIATLCFQWPTRLRWSVLSMSSCATLKTWTVTNGILLTFSIKHLHLASVDVDVVDVIENVSCNLVLARSRSGALAICIVILASDFYVATLSDFQNRTMMAAGSHLNVPSMVTAVILFSTVR